jgi:hypothetical protein
MLKEYRASPTTALEVENPGQHPKTVWATRKIAPDGDWRVSGLGNLTLT